jgi:hypothetical protein
MLDVLSETTHPGGGDEGGGKDEGVDHRYTSSGDAGISRQ